MVASERSGELMKIPRPFQKIAVASLAFFVYDSFCISNSSQFKKYLLNVLPSTRPLEKNRKQSLTSDSTQFVVRETDMVADNYTDIWQVKKWK